MLWDAGVAMMVTRGPIGSFHRQHGDAAQRHTRIPNKIEKDAVIFQLLSDFENFSFNRSMPQVICITERETVDKRGITIVKMTFKADK